MKPTKLELDILSKRVDAAINFTRDMFEGQHLLLGEHFRNLRGEVFEALCNLSEGIEEMQMEMEIDILEEDDEEDYLLGSKVVVDYMGAIKEGEVLEKVGGRYRIQLNNPEITIYRYDHLLTKLDEGKYYGHSEY